MVPPQIRYSLEVKAKKESKVKGKNLGPTLGQGTWRSRHITNVRRKGIISIYNCLNLKA